jgi:thiaminase/transcriptional activator TenA
MRALFLFACAALLPAQSTFTDELWRAARPVYEATLAHPFLKGVADGTLPRDRFDFYMTQDSKYLVQYSKALAVLAARAPREEWALFFAEGVQSSLKVEKALHGTYVTVAEMDATTMAPTNTAYTNHLLATVSHGSFAEGVAAVLPCYWVYWEVGKEIQRRGSKSGVYQRWVNMYANEAFGKKVREILAIMNAAAEGATAEEKLKMQRIFLISTRYEYQFWDMAWRKEEWKP